jgi:general secretion pathway protein N
VTRQRLALYCAVGVLVYVAALVAMMPASWISRALERASQDRLLVRSPTGTLWAGSARVYARERSGPPLELGELRWKTAWSGLLAAKLASHVAFGGAERPVRVELSPAGVSVQGLDLALPGRVLASFVPGLETFGPTGELRLRAESLRVDDDSILGVAEIQWRHVRLSRAPGLDLGSHVAKLRGTGSKVDIELATLEGPLRLNGQGSWNREAGLKMTGSAEHGVEAPPELPQFLRAVCTDYRNNRCGFRFAL